MFSSFKSSSFAMRSVAYAVSSFSRLTLSQTTPLRALSTTSTTPTSPPVNNFPSTSSSPTTSTSPQSSTIPASSSSSTTPAPTSHTTHFKITLRRSAIALDPRYKRTLIALGLKRRLQTVYHRHSSVTAGKILRVKELVDVENVPESEVRTKEEQREERKAGRGYAVVKTLKDSGF